MKNSKWLIAAIAAILVIAVVLIVILMPKKSAEGSPAPTETQTQETTAPEVTLDAQMGIVDGSIFDDWTDYGTTPQDPTSDAGEPEPTEPTAAPITKPEHLNSGLENPDAPEQLEPDISEPNVTEPPKNPAQELTYQQFKDLPPAQQQEYQESFESIDAFFEWYNAAKEAYDKENPPILIGPDGVVDLDKIPQN